MNNSWKRNAPFIERLGKEPAWSCAGCGRRGNWFKRAFCRCGREPPASVCRAQKRAMEGKGSERREEQRGKSNERRNEGTGTYGKSYAAVVNGGEDSKLERELEALRKQLAAERKEKESLQKRVNNDDDDCEMAEDEDDATEDRDARIQTLTADLQSVARVCGENSPPHIAAKAELERLVRARREEKPLRAQLQNSERRISRQKAKVDRLSEKGSELEAKLKELKQEQEKVDEELMEALSSLGCLERERKQLLLREAQGDTGDGGGKNPGGTGSSGGGGGSAIIDDDAAWNHVYTSIATRASQPGVDPNVANQLGMLMQSVIHLCKQLGNGGPPTVPAASVTSPPLPAGQANEVTTVEGITGGGTDQQPSGDQSPTPTDANLGGAAHDQPATTTAGAEEVRPPPPIVEQPPAEVDGTAASGGAAAVTGASPTGDADGSESEAESTRAMDVESTLASIPVEQRARVREALARRKKDQKGPRKLKKPPNDEIAKGVGGDGKKPTK